MPALLIIMLLADLTMAPPRWSCVADERLKLAADKTWSAGTIGKGGRLDGASLATGLDGNA
jgi:hypothetical protein